MTLTRFLIAALLGLTSAFALASCSSDSSSGEQTGSLALLLTIDDGIVIERVDWTITGGEMPPMSDSIDVSAPGSTVSAEVFGLPEGDFVIELMATSTDGETRCGGSAPFSVEAGEVTQTHVLLRCQLPPRFGGVRVDGKLNICAELTKAVVSPLQTSVGNVINLMADAEDTEGDPIRYQWTALTGTIAEPANPITIYTCTTQGDDEITITVSDDDFNYCMSSWTVPVTCVGNGGGTGGAGGAAGAGGMPGTGGSAGTAGSAGEGGGGGTAGAGGAAGAGGQGGAGGQSGAGGMAGSAGQGGTGGCDCQCDCDDDDSDSDTDRDCKYHPVWNPHPKCEHPPTCRRGEECDDDRYRHKSGYGYPNECTCDCDCDDEDSDSDSDSDDRMDENSHPHESWKHWFNFWFYWWAD